MKRKCLRILPGEWQIQILRFKRHTDDSSYLDASLLTGMDQDAACKLDQSGRKRPKQEMAASADEPASALPESHFVSLDPAPSLLQPPILGLLSVLGHHIWSLEMG